MFTKQKEGKKIIIMNRQEYPTLNGAQGPEHSLVQTKFEKSIIPSSPSRPAKMLIDKAL